MTSYVLSLLSLSLFASFRAMNYCLLAFIDDFCPSHIDALPMHAIFVDTDNCYAIHAKVATAAYRTSAPVA